jgi:hypothetical protein
MEEEPPDLSPEAMEEARSEMVEAKEELKAKKEMLNDAYDRMRILLPEWHKGQSQPQVFLIPFNDRE